jgi:hypothetical protein
MKRLTQKSDCGVGRRSFLRQSSLAAGILGMPALTQQARQGNRKSSGPSRSRQFAQLIFVALAQVVFSLHPQTIGRFFSKVMLAILYGFAGIVLLFSTIVSSPDMTIVLGTLFLVSAGVEAATALEVRPVDGWR